MITMLRFPWKGSVKGKKHAVLGAQVERGISVFCGAQVPDGAAVIKGEANEVTCGNCRKILVKKRMLRV